MRCHWKLKWRHLWLTILAAVSLEMSGGPGMYLAGSGDDVEVEPDGGLLLAGGGGDVDAAMAWFIRLAKGGDVLVLRASGGDGYQDYLFSGLTVPVNAVRTLVFSDREQSKDPEVQALLRSAEAIFIAGGDQSRYIRFWKGTPVQDLLQRHIEAGKPIGGTSAGLAILGEFSYAALHAGDLTSALALARPQHHWITLERGFLRHPYLKGILTDTHFSERARLGRLLVMLGRAGRMEPDGPVLGLGVDEQTALIVEKDGTATVLGEGGVHLIVPAPAEESMFGKKGFGPQEAEVIVLGSASRFNLASMEVQGPADQFRVRAEAGRLFRLEDGREAAAGAAKRHGGALVIVGGALRDSNTAIHEALVALADLRGAGVLGILPAASTRPVQTARAFKGALQRYGVEPDEVRILPLAVMDDPTTAEVDESSWLDNRDDPETAEMIKACDAIWLTGGDQARIMRVMRDQEGEPTLAGAALNAFIASGGVLGGTSAGAAVQSGVMILGGTSKGALRYGIGQAYASMKDQETGPLILGKGLGYFPHGIIDQHFDRKARLGRLVVALLESGNAHGFGIDEDTALIYELDTQSAEVQGSGSVVWVDMTEAQVDENGISGIRLSVLSEGDRLQFPGPTLTVHPERAPIGDSPYYSMPDVSAFGLMDPYGGRLADVLGYLLADNGGTRTVPSMILHPDGVQRDLLFSKDAQTRGYWGATDGQMGSYTVHKAVLAIGPERRLRVPRLEGDQKDELNTTP